MTLVACGGASAVTPTIGDECARHEQCRDGRFCVEARCVRGGDASVDAERWFAEPWFSRADGECERDEQCGPWLCADSACVSPQTAGRPLPARRAFAYWDTSCSGDEDCPSGWACRRDWCTEGERGDDEVTQLGAHASALSEMVDELDGGDSIGLVEVDGVGIGSLGGSDGEALGTDSIGSDCLWDGDCGDEEDCLAPGICTAGIRDDAMTWSDAGIPRHFSYDDGSCDEDRDCGGYVCSYGYCEPPEFVLSDLPTRAEIQFTDGSCSQSSHCGSWTCDEGWCRDPGRVN